MLRCRHFFSARYAVFRRCRGRYMLRHSLRHAMPLRYNGYFHAITPCHLRYMAADAAIAIRRYAAYAMLPYAICQFSYMRYVRCHAYARTMLYFFFLMPMLTLVAVVYCCHAPLYAMFYAFRVLHA